MADSISHSVQDIPSRGQVLVVGAVLLVFAALILWLAVPRFVAGMVMAPHDVTLAGLDKPSPPSPGARSRAASAYGRALLWFESPQSHAALGALALADAHDSASAGDAAVRAQADRSTSEILAALRLSPLQPYIWARLVQADLAGGAANADVARHVGMSLRTAPWDPALVTTRLGLAFAVWGDLDPKTRDEFVSQIRHAARFYPTALARQVRQRHAQEPVVEALEADPDLLRRFSLAYSRI